MTSRAAASFSRRVVIGEPYRLVVRRGVLPLGRQHHLSNVGAFWSSAKDEAPRKSRATRSSVGAFQGTRAQGSLPRSQKLLLTTHL
jgi:hypothetical protein